MAHVLRMQDGSKYSVGDEDGKRIVDRMRRLGSLNETEGRVVQLRRMQSGSGAASNQEDNAFIVVNHIVAIETDKSGRADWGI